MRNREEPREHGTFAKPSSNRERGVIQNDKFKFWRVTIFRSRDLVENNEAIPEVGGRSPETGFALLRSGLKGKKLDGNTNKNKELLRWNIGRELARRVHYQETVDAFR
jgi:hypothetical protein